MPHAAVQAFGFALGPAKQKLAERSSHSTPCKSEQNSGCPPQGATNIHFNELVFKGNNRLCLTGFSLATAAAEEDLLNEIEKKELEALSTPGQRFQTRRQPMKARKPCAFARRPA